MRSCTPPIPKVGKTCTMCPTPPGRTAGLMCELRSRGFGISLMRSTSGLTLGLSAQFGDILWKGLGCRQKSTQLSFGAVHPVIGTCLENNKSADGTLLMQHGTQLQQLRFKKACRDPAIDDI